MALNIAGPANAFGRVTQTAGTLINRLIPPSIGLTTIITRLLYVCSTTAHTLTILRPIGRTTVASAAASGQAVVNITADPGPAGDQTTNAAGYPQGVTANLIAANDIVAIRETDGVTRQYKVSSVSTLAITLTGNLTAGAAAGASFWFYGIIGDTDPKTGLAHPTLLQTVSVTNSFSDTIAGIGSTFRADEPIIIQSDNATAAGSIEAVSYVGSPKVGNV